MLKFCIAGVKGERNHYRDCAICQVPWVEVKHGRKYSRISFDVSEMVQPSGLPDEQPSDFVIALYKTYARFFSLPAHKFSCVGGSNNLTFIVYREHTEFFAAQLYDYLLKFVSTAKR